MTTPTMTETFLVEANLDTPEFQSWFRKSKVVDDSGKPLVVYHGTTVGDFEVFRKFNDLGHHFGSSAAANDRIASRQKDTRYKDEPGRIYPVYLSIQNPMWLDDAGTWEPDGIARQLAKNYERESRLVNTPEFTPDEATQIAMKPDRKSKTDEFVKIAKKHGYDGVRYRNTAEDVMSVSWIAFDPWQIKSVYNRGTWDKRRGSIME